MRLDDYAIRPRVRNAWEVMDLGTLLFQRDAAGTLRSACLVWLPVGLLTGLLLYFVHFLAAIAFLWLARPLLGRVALFRYSRRVFSVQPSPSDVAQAIPKFVFRRAWRTLVVRRLLGRSRTFTDPVVVLEELDGVAYRKRVQDLLGGDTRGAMWRLGRGMALIEMCLSLALFATLGVFFQDFFEVLTDLRPGDAMPAQIKAAVLFTLWAVIFVSEPLWTATGFAMYLNRRSELEGWDVELVFRSLAQRVEPTSSFPAAAILLLGVFLFPGRAIHPEGSQTEQAETAVERVYARSELQTSREQWVLGESQSARDSEPFGDLSKVFDGIVWTVLLALVAVVLFHLFRWALGRNPVRVGPRPRVVSPVEEVLGLDLRPQSLPKDILGTAQELWAKGEAKAALSLLYRGSLVRLTERDSLVLEPGDTEALCLRKVQALGPDERTEYFGALTQFWQALAYGARRPKDAEFAQLTSGYRAHFGGSAWV
ncbi:MAG TPA: hypothetical protein P5218_02755 [Planctomycetota bacterium]|nr:hypothetical protein [Planctomycetota bacterium]HRV80323.1 hypothetical protein [Planctomycetota bacterium]